MSCHVAWRPHARQSYLVHRLQLSVGQEVALSVLASILHYETEIRPHTAVDETGGWSDGLHLMVVGVVEQRRLQRK